jgi:glycosyltransferase involved in cell wall biosynthesis
MKVVIFLSFNIKNMTLESLAVSVVIPVKNEASTILALLDSLISQSLLPSEIIIVDSGSTDLTTDLIEDAIHKGINGIDISIIKNPNGLPGANRNLGVASARYEWIAFIDAGIIPSIDWLAELCSRAKDTNTKSVFGLCQFESSTAFEMATCALSYGCGSRHPVLPASLFHRSVFERIGYFREDLRAAEDIVWLKELDRIYGPRVVCHNALVYYLQFPKNVRSVIIKWWIYTQNTLYAGMYHPRIWLLPLFFFLLTYLFVVSASLGFSLLSAYLLGRGIVDPIRRGRSLVWWSYRPTSALIAVWLCLVIDITKSLSLVIGGMRKFLKYIRTQLAT